MQAKLEEQIKDNRRALIESLDKGLRRQERNAKVRGKVNDRAALTLIGTANH